MSRDLQEGPTAVEVEAALQEIDARIAAREHIPTIAVFVEGGLIQDVCFDGAVRVVVIDFDQENDDPDDDKMANYTDPQGRTSRVGVGMWERNNAGGNWTSDVKAVCAALRAAGEEGSNA